MPKRKPPFIRLYDNIKKEDDGCWLWLGQKTKAGYGQIKAFKKIVSCHRLSYELNFGLIPTGLEVMHSCDIRSCINPDHLSIGTHADNMADMIKKGRKVLGKPNPRRGIEKSQSKQVIALGKPYGSINEAEREIGVGNGVVSYWVKNNPEKARVISKDEYLEMIDGK